MTKCAKCGFDESGYFCRQCGNPIDHSQQASLVSDNVIDVELENADTQQIMVVCPKCKTQSLQTIMLSFLLTSDRGVQLQCPRCKARFVSRIVKIKAKNSQGDKKGNKRTFSVRIVEFSKHEGLIQFQNASYQDFELRARDLVIFSYLKNKLAIVQNLTVGQYMEVSNPACFIATHIYGANSREVNKLRLFRDQVLLQSFILSRFVSFYYFISPILIRTLGRNNLFREISRSLLSLAIKGIDNFWKGQFESDT